MDSLPSTSEIVESTEEFESNSKIDEKDRKQFVPKSGNRFSIEDDINQLFEAISTRKSSKAIGQSSKDCLQKKAMKRPMRIGSPQMSGIGISEPVSLKQALRGLCISQASEMAAMKRLSKPLSSLGPSEIGAIKRLYRTVVVEANRSGFPLNEDSSSLVEISLVPERVASSSMASICESSQIEKTEIPHQIADSSLGQDFALHRECKSEISLVPERVSLNPMASICESSQIGTAEISHQIAHSSLEMPKAEIEKQKSKDSLSTCLASEALPEIDEKMSSSGLMNNLACNTPRFMKPIFRNKSFAKKKVKQDSFSISSSSIPSNSGNCDDISASGEDQSVKANPTSSLDNEETSSSKVGSSNSINTTNSILIKIDERSRSGEKGGEFSQSSKSSIGDYSCSTSTSGESNLSGSSRCGNRPHMSRDTRWIAIRSFQRRYGNLGLKNFKLIKKLGCGDIGSVYLAELTSTGCLFALKVMDNEFLVSKKKISRSETEREILQMLDHPFLPTLYAHFVSDRFSCLVMEYCPGGDLHVLRQKQPSRSFSEQATRFYVAEVLLALEYLHMLGVVYRDLKPENILVREDGHIMLSDFDLSLKSAGNPIMVQSSSPIPEASKKMSSPCSVASCIDPFCLHPTWQVSCFTPRLLSVASKSRKSKPDLFSQITSLPQLVVEPTNARSNSFVGTHEYLAPEIIKGEGHGSAVDWWTFGIFLFELLYGKTPFKGVGNEDTLSNVVSRSLKFPSTPIVSFHARDLIRGLLIKEPENRLGSAKGAAEIKQHAFFEGLNWALIRCAMPPEMPKFCDSGNGGLTAPKCMESRGIEEYTEFEMF